MSLLETILPKTANNDFRGGKVPVVVFCLFIAVMTFRSLVHFLMDDSGVNAIASIHVFPFAPGAPDPNNVIYMFSSLWGSQQVIMVMIYLLVLYRYRNFIPLMFVLMMVEVCFRLTVGMLHPLTEEFYVRTPPGKFGNLPFFVLSALMLYLSHRNIAKSQDPVRDASVDEPVRAS